MGRKRSYPAAFRQQMVALVRSGRSANDLAKEFEPTAQTISAWVRQADRDEGRREDGLTSRERVELQRLRKENKRLRQEREILAKAAAWFARETDAIPLGDIPKIFRFIRAHQAVYPITLLCRTLDVSTSGYYAWCHRRVSKRAQDDKQLTEQIRTFHQRSNGTYGAPRIFEDLRGIGVNTSKKRVARLMRQAQIYGVSRRKGIRTTHRSLTEEKAPDLVKRDFKVDKPNKLWVADITYIPTWSGFLYLSVVLDAFSRRVVGWAMAKHLKTQLVLDALDMALWNRQPDAVIHHSDQGSQYTSYAFGQRCARMGVRPSVGSVGDCFDNALCESFFATLECELIDRHSFPNHSQAKLAIFEYIEGWYNPHRRHSAIRYLSPITYEKLMAQDDWGEPSTLSTKAG